MITRDVYGEGKAFYRASSAFTIDSRAYEDSSRNSR